MFPIVWPHDDIQQIFLTIRGSRLAGTIANLPMVPKSYLVVLYLSLVREVELGEGDAVLLPVGAATRVQRERPQVVPPDVPLGVNLDHVKLPTTSFTLQGGSGRHGLGWVNMDLGSFPGCLAAIFLMAKCLER